MEKKLTVILDAGHGIETPGKRSPIMEDGSQLLEWEFNREVCNIIKFLLEEEGFKCILANDVDEDWGLSARAENINNIYNDEKELGNKCIMISVHGNAMGNGDWMQGRGWEVYTTRKKTNSDKLAKCFLEVFEDIFPDQTLRGHKEADFTVIYKTNCPCVLTENFFFDNKEDCQLMMSMEGKIRIAKLHVEAIKKYYNEIC